MKSSIRLKLFVMISGLVVFYVLLSWLLNTLLLDKYYFYSKKNSLMESYNTINSIYKGNPEDITLDLEKISSTEGLHIIILDSNFETKYSSYSKKREFVIKRSGPLPFPDARNPMEAYIKSNSKQVSKGETFVEITKDSRLNSDFINFCSLLKNGDYILLNSPVAAINESVDIANKFFILTGIITIMLGSVLIYVLTGRFTNPILELNGIAQRMSLLDFSNKYTIRTNDEIGQLGMSINSLSEQLDKSIMELRQANDKLMKDIQRERKIDEARKEFVSNVSHELKTPIALIQGYAEGLKVNVNVSEEKKAFYCEVIIDEAYKMNRLVKQLLELAQIESGQINLEKEKFDISMLIDQVLKKNALIFSEKNINVEFEPEENIIVNADYHKIEQVLMNYINNAVNHINDKKVIRVSLKKLDKKARVYVYNSGQHIPVESLEKIWTSFYKADKARTRAYGGTGLGLAIVKAIQDADMQGYGANNVEDGVEFWFDAALVLN